MKNLSYLSFAASLLLFAGCGEKPAAVWAPTMENPPATALSYCGKDTSVPNLKDADVIVAVNGATMTKAEFYKGMELIWWTLTQNKLMRDKDRTEIYNRFGRERIGKFVRDQVLIQRGRADRVATESEVRAAVADKIKTFCKTYAISEEKIDGTVPGGKIAVQRDAENNFWIRTYLERNKVKGPIITLEAVSNLMQEVAQENAAVARSNAVIKARLEVIRREIAAGRTTFAKMAAMYNDDEHCDSDGRWGIFRRRDLPEEGDAVFELPVGALSPVLEDDETYYLVTVLARNEPKRDKDGKLVAPESVELAKIQQTKEEYTVLADDAKGIQADFQRQMDNEAALERVEKLKAEATIVYPHGTNFWQQAKEEK